MANIKISSLPQATVLTGTEQVPLVQGGTTKRATSQLLGALAVGPTGPQGPPGPTGPAGSGSLDWVNVKVAPFSAKGDGVTDDTAAIQAAIDYAYNNNIQTIYMPSGRYVTSSTLYLDAPGNLRTNRANPTIFGFALTLGGEVGQAGADNQGVQILPTFNNDIALLVGTGTAMMVSNIKIVGPSNGYRIQQSSSGVGIGISGGSGGATQTLIEGCSVKNFHYGYQTGATGNGSLGDSNRFHRCTAQNAWAAFNIGSLENLINTFTECTVYQCTNGLVNSLGAPCQVYGGNWSPSSAQFGSYAMTNVSTLTAGVAGLSKKYTFTATVSAPDALMSSGVYDNFAILTTSYGAVRLHLNSWVPGAGANLIPGTAIEDATDAFWNDHSGETISANTTIDPRGNLLADSMVETGAGGGHAIGSFNPPGGVTITAGNTFIWSREIKPGIRTWATLEAYNSAFTHSVIAFFNLTGAGSVGTTSSSGGATISSATITAQANGFYLCTITGTLAPADTLLCPYCRASTANGVFSYTGSNGSTALILGQASLTLSAGTATFLVEDTWCYFAFGPATDVVATTNFQAQVQAATTVYAGETCTVFSSNAVDVRGVHIENPSALTRFFANTSSFGGASCIYKDINLNWDIAFGNSTNPANSLYPLFVLQQVVPFIEIAASVHLENINPFNTGQYVLIQWNNESKATFDNVTIPANMYCVGPAFIQEDVITAGLNTNTIQFGGGIWDHGNFISSNATNANQARTQGWGGPPYTGSIYVPWAIPNVPIGKVPVGTLGALGTYPILLGNQIYQTTYPQSKQFPQSTTAPFNGATFFKSRHRGWSYGQNLTLNFSYIGQSTAFYVDNFNYLFVGLTFSIVNGGTTSWYTIIGMHPGLGYVQVQLFGTSSITTFVLPGNKLTTFTGASIGQDAYSFDLLTSPLECVLSSNYTLADVNTAQPAFNATTNGALTLDVGTYDFEALYLITNTGTTAHTWATAFAGGATYTIEYFAEATSSVGNVLTAPNLIRADSKAAVVVTAPSVSNTENVIIRLRGILRVTVAGTFIPQVALSAATTGTEVMLANSFIKLTPASLLGTFTTSGDWS